MLIDMNLIGAYVVTLVLLAIAKARPDLSKVEMVLRYSLVIRGVVALWLAAVGLHSGAGMIVSGAWVTAPAYLLWAASLWIHEAGHFYLVWAGTFLHVLGGTLAQLLFPLGAAVFCVSRSFAGCAGLFVYWLGLNCFDVGRYISDARARALPLFGSHDASMHDWHTILGVLGLLEYDKQLGAIVGFSGWVIGAAGLAIFLFSSYFPPAPSTSDP